MKRASCLLVLLVAAATWAISDASSGHASRAESSPESATLATFAGRWLGHTRGLRITRTGHATESIYSGCCDPALNVTFRLSQPRGTPMIAAATATATGVWVRDKGAFTKGSSPPHVGETRTVRLRNGVLTESLTGATYCDRKADGDGKCGA
jgi:hypothetical protein